MEKKEKLLSLKSRKSWEATQKAARIRKNDKVIILAACINETKYPKIRFHETCCFIFTMKKDLEILQKQKLSQKKKNSNVGRLVVHHQALVVNVRNESFAEDLNT